MAGDRIGLTEQLQTPAVVLPALKGCAALDSFAAGLYSRDRSSDAVGRVGWSLIALPLDDGLAHARMAIGTYDTGRNDHQSREH